MSAFRKRLRESSRSTIATLGLTSLFAGFKDAPGRILCYHNVAPAENDFLRGLAMTVTPATFERQLRYLANEFRVVPLSQMLAELRGGSMPPRTVALTFDDGYRDLFEHAFPLLRQYDMPATIFVNPAVVDSTRKLWPNQVAYLVNRLGPATVIDAARGYWNGRQVELEDGTSLGQIVWDLGMQVHVREIAAFVAETCARHKLTAPDDEPTRLYLEWREMGALSAQAIEFGNHTQDHANLGLLNEDEQAQQIETARDAIVSNLGVREIAFAYPFGQVGTFTAKTPELVARSGHTCALTVIDGPVRVGDMPYDLRRIDIREVSFPMFVAAVNGISLRAGLDNVTGRLRKAG